MSDWLEIHIVLYRIESLGFRDLSKGLSEFGETDSAGDRAPRH